MNRRVWIHYAPDDPGEKWKRTIGGCLDRLKQCKDGMDRDHGATMNLKWMHWSSEWQSAFEWLEWRHPRAARRFLGGDR